MSDMEFEICPKLECLAAVEMSEVLSRKNHLLTKLQSTLDNPDHDIELIEELK